MRACNSHHYEEPGTRCPTHHHWRALPFPRTKGDASNATGRRSSPAPSYLASRDASQQHTERGNRIANSDMAGHSGRRAGTTSAQIGAHLGVFMPRETGGELRNGPNPRGGKRGTESRTSFYFMPHPYPRPLPFGGGAPSALYAAGAPRFGQGAGFVGDGRVGASLMSL